MTFLGYAILLGFTLVILGVALASVRLIKGPTLADRIVALDMMTVQLVAFAGLSALQARNAAFLDVAVVMALVGFLATVCLARYLERSSNNNNNGNNENVCDTQEKADQLQLCSDKEEKEKRLKFIKERIANFIAACVFGALAAGWFMLSSDDWMAAAPTFITDTTKSVPLSAGNVITALAIIAVPTLLSIFVSKLSMFTTSFWDGYNFTLFSAIVACVTLLYNSGEGIPKDVAWLLGICLFGGFVVYVIALPYIYYEAVLQKDNKRRNIARISVLAASGLVTVIYGAMFLWKIRDRIVGYLSQA